MKGGGADERVVGRFCDVAERVLGLDLQMRTPGELKQLLHEQSSSARLTVSEYVDRLEQGGGGAEWLDLVNVLTVGETYFFRHVEQLRACAGFLARLRTELGGSRPIRVLSAGCSSGEEAYSLAMLLYDMGFNGATLEIVGLDINPLAIERARAARFSAWALRETDAATTERWFRRERGRFRLSQTILDGVKFVRGNLVASIGEPFGDYDVIMCRNVLMYFTAKQFELAVGRLLRALRPGGALFLGHAESLRGTGVKADAVHEFGVFYYRRPIDFRGVAREVTAAKSSSLELSTPAVAATSACVAEPGLQPSFELAKVEDLLRRERFAEALDELENHTDVQADTAFSGAGMALRSAMLHVYSNRTQAAATILDALVNEETISAEVHYAMALCHEAEARFQDAFYHHGLAANLDPTFAMPWLHLGLLNRRMGHASAARRQLLQARALLAVETPERVLWFGGGSSRAHLLDACGGLEGKADGR